jgi:uncharacterized protein YndB with AHSA1/START domain
MSAADGTVELIDGRHVLTFERHLAHPVERVWAALTEPDELAGWLAQAELELTEGGSLVLRWQNRVTEEDAERYGIELPEDDPGPPVVRGTVTRLDPPRLIEWDTDGHGVLRWELREEGSGCVLRFTNMLPPEAEFPVAQSLAGWHMHLDLLEEALAGRAADWPNWPIERWAQQRDRYAMQHA